MSQSRKVAWVLRNYPCSMMPSKQNKLGDSYIIKTLCSIGFLNLNSFQLVLSWKLKRVKGACMHGGVS